MKLGRLTVERKSDAEVKADKQDAINKVRAGGFRKVADREQAKLDRKK